MIGLHCQSYGEGAFHCSYGSFFISSQTYDGLGWTYTGRIAFIGLQWKFVILYYAMHL